MGVVAMIEVGKQSIGRLWIGSDLVEVGNGVKRMTVAYPVIVLVDDFAHTKPFWRVRGILWAERKYGSPDHFNPVLMPPRHKLRCGKDQIAHCEVFLR